MKKSITIIAFYLASFIATITAIHASESWDYDYKSTQLLTTVFQSCPIEFIQAMKGANRVGKTTFQSDRTGQWTTITTVGGGYAPTFESYDVSILKISKIRIENDHIPDAPTTFQTTCELSAAKPNKAD